MLQNSYNDMKTGVSSFIQDDVLSKGSQYVANKSTRPSLVRLDASKSLHLR